MPKDSTKQLGELMLKGWTLLADICPICSTPLMSKNKGTRRCVSCDADVLTEAEMAARPKQQIVSEPKTTVVPLSPERSGSAEPKVQQVQGTKAKDTKKHVVFEDGWEHGWGEEEDDDVDVPTSFEELKREWDLKSKSRDATSAKLGNYMLQGWVMLAALCPFDACSGTPLMRSSDSKQTICVSCDRQFKALVSGEFEVINGVAPTLTPLKPPTTLTTPVPAAAPAMAAVKSSLRNADITLSAQAKSGSAPSTLNDLVPFLPSPPSTDQGPSAMLAKRLVQGWAMLDEVCTSTTCKGHVPLMRDRSGKKMCVVCEGNSGSVPTPAPAPATVEAAEENIEYTSRADRAARLQARADSLDDLDEDDSVVEAYSQKRLGEIINRAGFNNKSTLHSSTTTSSSSSVPVSSASVPVIPASVFLSSSPAKARHDRASATEVDASAVARRAVNTRLVAASLELESCGDVARSIALVELIVKLSEAAALMGELEGQEQ